MAGRPTGRRGSSRLFVVLALGVVILGLRGPAASAGSLVVEGPAGTEVLLDGEFVGVLPMEAIECAKGFFPIECRLRGHLAYKGWVNIPDEDSEVVHSVELLPLDRRTAMLTSAFLAGTGHLYQGRKLKGWSLIALQSAAWLTVFAAEAEFQSTRDDFERLDQEYSEAVLASEISRLREDRQAAYDDMENLETLRAIGIGAVVAVGAYAIFDAWKGHNAFFAGVESAPPAAVEGLSMARDTGVHLGIRARF